MSQKSISDLVAPSPWPVETLSSTTFSLTEDFRDEWLESSTVQQDRLEEIRLQTVALFEAAKDQRFEDGMESEFSNELVALVEKHDDAAIKAIAHFITSEIVNDEVASEALRWLGRLDHPTTYHARLRLLERSLFCSSARIRDGAALGLAAMDDPHAITCLEQAIQREKNAELREDLTQVLTQLETSEQCR
jgi:HEAT repeat protein